MSTVLKRIRVVFCSRTSLQDISTEASLYPKLLNQKSIYSYRREFPAYPSAV